ncbi:MAG: DUF6599 family protein [Acidobacteriota bacterium]
MNFLKILIMLFVIFTVLCLFPQKLTDLKDYLPLEKDIPGLRIVEKLRYFYPKNLYEYINGAAEVYNSYGFKKVINVEYEFKRKSRYTFIVDLYEMKDVNNAFGIYSNERPPEANFIEVGAEGYFEEFILNFWKDRFYIKILTFDAGDEFKNVLIKSAKVIANKLPGKNENPPIISLFPEQNKIKNSEIFINKGVLGYLFLKEGFIANYKYNGKQFRVFIIFSDNIKEIEKMFSDYKNNLSLQGIFAEKISGLGEEAFFSRDPYHREVYVVKYRKHLIGVIDGIDKGIAFSYLSKILQRIREKKS